MARIVFDLDGTLIDSAPDIQAVANGVLGAEGHQPITLDQTRSFIGNGAPTFVARMRAARDIPDSEQDRLLTAFKIGYVSAVDLTVIYDGAIAALEALRAQGHRLGICTNKPFQPTQSVLAHLDMTRLFDVVIGGDSLPVHKPDPAMLHAALDQLGDGPVIYVGDSGVDAKTAENAGVPFVLTGWGYRNAQADDLRYDALIASFSELPEVIKRLSRG